MTPLRRVFVTLCIVLAAGPALSDADGPLTEIADFGANPGNLRMQVYLPHDLRDGAALVVVAHGCFQTVDQVVEHTGWIELADEYRFALLFPQTGKGNEPFGGCFRTWYPEHQKRGAGEPLSIRNQVLWLLDAHALDADHVFMTGQSSGGLVTSVMLASYPELFAAGAVQSAYPYRCADAFEELAPCSLAQRSKSPAEWAALVLDAAPGYDGVRPRIALWHGGADVLIVPANLDLQLQQWAGVLGIDSEAGAEDSIDGQVRHRYADGEGTVQIETVVVAGMDHAIAIDPDGTPACGSTAPYIVDADVCAARWIGRWFGVVPEAL